ncbi:MAG: NAD-dependent epimerase/dehydratase family protein [Oligoflexia bacterium]|nr:NAD-dependent epimerase/dehydratase family protein [Oligoflexia bacterium]
MNTRVPKVLLTGAAGFIGSKVAHNLLRRGIKVVAVDNLNDYYDPRLKEHRLAQITQLTNGLERSFEFHKIDIEDIVGLRKLFLGNITENVETVDKAPFTAVINLAARAGVRASMENPFVYQTTNANGTLNLLELMREFGVKKFVLASTSSLYAGLPMPFHEELPVNTPISPYAASKKAAEMMAYSYHFLYGIDVSVLRYFTVYGPAGRPDMCMFRFIKWIDQGEALTLYGDGEQTRDFTYVDDIAEGTVRAMCPLGFEVINLGGGRGPTSLIYVINKIEEYLGKKAKINYHPFHKADLKETMADIKKAGRILNGWRPLVSVDDGIKNSVEWYMQNRDLVKGLC